VNKQKLLILGGGFGGFFTYVNLPKAFKAKALDITIVSKSEDFVFAPMIIESFTGEIDDKDVQFPLRDIINKKQVRIVIAEVLSINLTKQSVHTNARIIEYDYLVIALGSQANYYDIIGAKKYSHALKSLDDVTVIANSVSNTLSEKPLKISIVGAGPTGVELAAKLSELTKPKRFSRTANQLRSTIELIEANDQILAYLPLKLSRRAAKILELQGITIRTAALINKVSKHALHLSGGRVIQSDIIIWTAGVRPSLPSITPIVNQNKNGQIKTDQYLRVLGYKNVFALGDVATVEKAVSVIPASAQAAYGASKLVASNIVDSIQGRELQFFNYRSKGIFIPLGKWKGVGQVAGINIHGPVVWIAWKLIYVWRFPIPKRRLIIGWHWLLRTTNLW
jgi:NADH dehydrogenase FAD-containing subunit